MPIVGPAPAAGAAPDWPLIEYAVCWSAGPNDTPVQDYWCNLSTRTEGSTTVRRGKQYELDQVQPGEMTLTFRNDDGVFDPTNTSSPFWPQVKPYRLIRLRAQYPATVNLLTATQAVGPFTGNQSVSGFSVTPGANFAAQCQGQGSGVTGTLALQWYSVTGALISTATGTPVALPATGWASVTVTAAAPANAVGAVLTFTQSGGTATTESYQVEQNTTPSTYATPGAWYSLFTGYVERWPQSWSSAGNYGTVAVDCVDLFGFLANAPLRDPFAADLLALNPNFLYQLNEDSGSTVFQDATSKRGRIIAPSSISLYTKAGESIQSGDNSPQGPDNSAALTGAFLGAAGPVVSSAALPTSGAPLSVAIPPDASGLYGPPTAGFTRIIAARATGATGDPNTGGEDALAMIYYNGNGVSAATQVAFLLEFLGDLKMHAYITDGVTSLIAAFPGLGPLASASGGVSSVTTVTDTDWHLYGYSLSSDGKTLTAWCDMSSVPASVSSATAVNLKRSGVGTFAFDIIGSGWLGSGSGATWIGDLAFACELPIVMDGATWVNLARSWRNAWASGSSVETSGTRYQRILDWIGYTGPTAVDGGSEVAYGPATDITGGSNPTYALQALQNVVTTEYGQHYIAADGTVTFKARTARYNPAPTVSFGEHSGEVPYTNASMDFDPTRVGNTVEVDAQYGNAAYFASDAASINDYGQVGIQQTVNSLDPESLQDGAEYLLYQNKQPLQRLAALPVDVGANPSAFASLLALELGTAVTVNRRPSAAPVISQVGYLEQIQWTIGEDRSCQWTAQVSNALAHYFGALDSTAYGRFGADGNTLNAAITSTATTLSIATAAGKAVFSNSSSDYPMNILVDAEQITLTAAPGGLTSPQTFTVTRGANGTTPASHSSGAAVSVVGSLVFGF